MRSEREMLDLILGVAAQDVRVQAVALSGSRTDKNAPPDHYRDYDVVYFVRELSSFLGDSHWIDRFGERVILQTPEAMTLFPPTLGGWFTFLMQFTDGNRIDLMLVPREDLPRYLENDTLAVALLDKDGLFPPLPTPSDRMFRVKKPLPAEFLDCCNEFWWTAPYVGKGLCRNEPLYAAYHVESCVRAELLRMLAWRAGFDTGFSCSVGKAHKYLTRYLTQEESALLAITYRLDTPEHIRAALEAALTLFRQTSRQVAERLDCPYPDFDEKVSRFLEEQPKLK